MAQFVHLHNHSDYSLLDGAQTVESIVKRAVNLEMPAIGLTEHGNMFSAVHFLKTAQKQGIKPVLGCEMYVADTDRFDKKKREHGGGNYHHFLLLIQNREGYENLIKLVTLGYTEGFYHRPRIDWELLQKYNSGLIATTACIKGLIQSTALKGDYEKAKQLALEYGRIFEGRFYLEVQNHGMAEELRWYEIAKKLASETGLPRVLTNDAHYTLPEHWEAHDAHLCIGTGKEMSDTERLSYSAHEYWIKTADEMAALYPGDPEILENTLKIAGECDFKLEFEQYYLPKFPIPEEAGVQTAEEYLNQLVEERLAGRYSVVTSEIRERVDYEMSVIRQMGFAGYFLIVQDFVHYARKNDIPVGPGRGSAAGSIVAFILGITDIDPLKYKLIFERFLNPERISMPDIDIDFCDTKRALVIDYIRKKYGENCVAQIITFGKMKARAVIRDVGRVLGMPLAEVNRIAKLVPETLNITLENALANTPELQEAASIDELHQKLFAISKVLEGLNRHSSTHAAGVVIAPGNLTDYIPLHQAPNSNDVTTQLDMKCIEQIGLLKVDLLGIRNLSVIANTLEMVREQGTDIDLNKIPEQDEKTLALFGEGQTIGIFQFESSGMREYLKKLKPSGIEDLIAMNALYRPGPMDMIDDFIDRKQGRKPITYLHPLMEPILVDTYGIIVYQEQVMQIAHRVAGFSLAKADLMRKAMGKKQKDTMESLQKEFVEGAVKNGISKPIAIQIYELIQRFAQYGFNRSHSAAYAILAYQCGYLKAHHPAEFMAANLSSEINNTDRITILSNEVRSMGYEIRPPDVNFSAVQFVPEGQAIRYGLNAIKNVGEKAAENIVAARLREKKFKTFFQFVAALDLKCVNRKVLESLIASGSTDSLEGTRGQKFAAIDTAIQYAMRTQEEKTNNQVSLFGLGSGANQATLIEPHLPDVPPWNDSEKWNKEKELLGMYLSGHPLLEYSTEIESFSNYDFTEPLCNRDKANVKLGGLVSGIKTMTDKKGRLMAFINLESLNGKVELIAFADAYEKYREYIKNDHPIFVIGTVNCRGEEDAKILVEEISPLHGLLNRKSKKLHVRINVSQHNADDLRNLKKLVSQHAGDCQFFLHLNDGNGSAKLIRSGSLRVSADRELLDILKKTFGDENAWVE
jgi:DNA polymerase-3 subunit alpha